jgi:hypothetical protein
MPPNISAPTVSAVSGPARWPRRPPRHRTGGDEACMAGDATRFTGAHRPAETIADGRDKILHGRPGGQLDWEHGGSCAAGSARPARINSSCWERVGWQRVPANGGLYWPLRMLEHRRQDPGEVGVCISCSRIAGLSAMRHSRPTTSAIWLAYVIGVHAASPSIRRILCGEAC